MMLVMMNFMKRGRVWTDNNDNTAVSLAPPQREKGVMTMLKKIKAVIMMLLLCLQWPPR